MTKAVVMITTNDDHEPIVQLFEDKIHALSAARESADRKGDNWYTEWVNGKGVYVIEPNENDDSFGITVEEMEVTPLPKDFQASLGCAQPPDTSKPTIKYLLCPGKVISIADGQEHYITSNMLIHLYDVLANECIEEFDTHKLRGIEGGKKKDDLVELAPQHDGNYSLPNKPTPLNHLTPIDIKWQFPESEVKELLDHLESEIRNGSGCVPYNQEAD